MKIRSSDKYSSAAFLLLLTAIILIVTAIILNRGELITPALIFSGTICAITGIFTLTFSGGEPVDPRFFGNLSAPGCLNLCSIASSLDITGHAHFLPPRATGEDRVMQFNPSSPYFGGFVYTREPFPKNHPTGLVSIPSCDYLVKDLRNRNPDLVLPGEKETVSVLLKETIEDVFNFAPRLSADWQDGTVTVTFHDLPFAEVCTSIAEKSAYCCTMSPCPACSLCAALIAEGTDKVIALNQCSWDPVSKQATAVFRMVP
jgi:hypothetical protein